MGDPFFQSESDPNKRKRPRRNNPTSSKPTSKSNTKSNRSQTFNNSEKLKQKPKKVLEDDVIESESDGNESDFNRNNDDDDVGLEEEEEEDFNETPAQKRLRLAQDYLNDLKQSQLREDGTFDAAEIDQEIISSRLQQDVLESSGRIHTYLGEKLSIKFNPTAESSTTNQPYKIYKTGRNHHRLPITCIKLSKEGTRLFVADKQGQIIQYDTSSIFNPNSNSNSDPNPTIKKTCIMKQHIPKKQTDQEKFKKKQTSKNHKTLSKIEVGDQFGHLGEVLSIDVSDDGKLLASAGKDKLLGVWDLTETSTTSEGDGNGNVEVKKWKAGIRGHKDIISSISFRSGTSTLYTASYDRMIKVYNLDSLTYSETLFGHQDQIQSISALNKETLVSAGGRDRTCRYWKILDESQLVFRGGGNSKLRDLIDGAGFDQEEDEDEDPEKLRKKKIEDQSKNFVEGSIDCVCMIDDTMFLSGGDSGSISLWSTHKKKAIFTQALAHGTEKEIINEQTQESIIKARWITSISSLAFSDLFCSGSWDGNVKIWKLVKGKGKYEIKRFELVNEIAVGVGIINSLDMVFRKRKDGKEEDGTVGIGVGIGQEHRLGRWNKIKEAKNHCCLISIEL